MSLTEPVPAVLAPGGDMPTSAPPFPPSDVDDLRSGVQGPVLVAGDEGLAAEVAAWNLAVRHTPAVAVGATCAADVRAAVAWAAEHGLSVAVQATGHGALADTAGSLLVNTSRMQGVHVDPEQRMARVQAGTRWHAVMVAAAEHGLAGLCGSTTDVGVVGYTLGGGLGSLGRRHGFAADHVRAVEMVTADGALRRVTAESEPELFWAVRGGKGNLGVVTAIEIDLVPVAGLHAGSLFFAAEDAATVLHAWRQWAPSVPEDVSTSVAIMRLPDMDTLPPPLRGRTVVHFRYCYSGPDPAEGERLVAPMRSVGSPLLGFIGPLRTDEMDAIHMDPVDPMPFWDKGALLASLDADAVEALLAVAGPQLQVPLFMVELRLLGGALSRPPALPNAVAGRDGAFALEVIGPAVPELADLVPLAGRGVLSALAPWRAPGNLVNFLGDVSGREEVAAAWSPETLRRLRAVKAAVDPRDVFSHGHAF